jgi:hypothetical protein
MRIAVFLQSRAIFMRDYLDGNMGGLALMMIFKKADRNKENWSALP